MGPTWSPPGSCRPQMGPMLAPWTLLSGLPNAILATSKRNGQGPFLNSITDFIIEVTHVQSIDLARNGNSWCANEIVRGVQIAIFNENERIRVILGAAISSIGKTPITIILWCPTTKMLIKACFLIQPLEQGGGCQKCCISLRIKVLINHFYQMKASPECLTPIYSSKYWADRLRRTLRRKV